MVKPVILPRVPSVATVSYITVGKSIVIAQTYLAQAFRT